MKLVFDEPVMLFRAYYTTNLPKIEHNHWLLPRRMGDYCISFILNWLSSTYLLNLMCL
jgi:hypothetical protein